MFRKKTVEADAKQFDGTLESAREIVEWVNGKGTSGHAHLAINPGHDIVLEITTESMMMEVVSGEYVVRDEGAPFYVCPEERFNETYEAI